MRTKKKSPAKREFYVWADYVRRMYQHVEAKTAKAAYAIAKRRSDRWEPCEWHEHNAYQLSNEVQDLATEEFIAIAGEKNCKTCGSEIVETINESNFRDGECGPCEYKRYASQSDLLDACFLAMEETGRWDEVLSGEDPEAVEAFAALQSAIAKAQENLPGTVPA